MDNKAVIIFIDEERGIEKDLEIPLDITAGDLVIALDSAFNMGMDTSLIRNCYLKSEHPIALLHGNRPLSEFGVRNGTVIHF